MLADVDTRLGPGQVDTSNRYRLRGGIPNLFRRRGGRGITVCEQTSRLGRFAMHASTGDRIVIESRHVGQPRRQGKVIEVLPGNGGREHFRVRWDDGHESTYFPSSDCHVVSAGGARSIWPLWS